jgi:hypothetical protein
MTFYSTREVLRDPISKAASKRFMNTLETASAYGLPNNLLSFYSCFTNIAANIMPIVRKGNRENPGQVLAGFRKDHFTPVSVHYTDVPDTQIGMGIYCPIINSGGLAHDASEDPGKLRDKLISLGIYDIPLVSKYNSGDDFLERFVVGKVFKKAIQNCGLEEYLDDYSHSNGFEMDFLNSVTKIGTLLNSKHGDWKKDLAFFDSNSSTYEKNDVIRFAALVNKTADMGVNIHDINVLLPEFNKDGLVNILSGKLLDRIRYYKQFTPDAIDYYGNGEFKKFSPERSLLEVGLNNCEEFIEHLLNDFIILDESKMSKDVIYETFNKVSSSHQMRRLSFS